MARTSTVTVGSPSVGFLGLLTLLFIGLKLAGYIGWSWWWVLAPTWIPAVFAILIITIVFGVVLKAKK